MFDTEICELANTIMDMIDAGRLGGYAVEQMVDLVAYGRSQALKQGIADYLQSEFGIV